MGDPGRTYLFSVKSERSTFSVDFEAADDNAATAHAIEWAAKAHVLRGSEISLVRPDGSLMDRANLARSGRRLDV